MVETTKTYGNVDLSQDNNFQLSLVEGKTKHSNTLIDIAINDKGNVTSNPGSLGLFYEPHISKPIRSQRQITIRYN